MISKKKNKSRKRGIEQAKHMVQNPCQPSNKNKSNSAANESMLDFISDIGFLNSPEYEYSLKISGTNEALFLISQFDHSITSSDVRKMLSFNLEHISIEIKANSPLQVDGEDYNIIQKAIALKRNGQFDESFQLYQELYDRIGTSHMLCKAWAKTSVLCEKYDFSIKLFRVAAMIMAEHKHEIDFQSLGGATVVFTRQTYKQAFNSYKEGIKGILR